MLVYVYDRFLRNYIWSLQPRQPGHQQLGSDTVFTVTVIKVFSGRGRHLLPAGRKYEVGPLLQRCEAAVATTLRKSGGSSSQRDVFALGNYIWEGTQLLLLASMASSPTQSSSVPKRTSPTPVTIYDASNCN